MASIIIGTDLDKKKFEKKYNELKSKLKREELNLNIKTENVEKAKKNLEDLQNELEATEARQRYLNDAIKEYEEFQAREAQLGPGERLKLTQEEAEKYNFLLKNIDKYKIEQAEINREVSEFNSKIEESNKKLNRSLQILDLQKEKVATTREEFSELSNNTINEQLKGISNSVTNITKKVARWALAVFGVRSAYLFLRSAMSTITEQDEQLKYDIQFIKNALAYSIEPIVRRIVEIAKTLIGYLAYILKAWSGGKIDIFAKASKSLASGAESAKEIEKSTASFDKFNKLGSSKGGTGGGVSGLTTPENANPPKWIVWISKNGKKVKSILLGIATALVAVQLGVGLFPALVIGAITAIVTFLVSKYNDIIDGFNKLLNWIKGPFYKKMKEKWGLVGALFVDVIYGAINGIKSLFEGLIGGIKKIGEGIIDIFKGSFTEGIKKVFGGLVDVMLAPFKALSDAVLSVIERILVALGLLKEFNSYLGGGSGSFGGGGGGGARAHGGIYYPALPKLAVGGIVNMPGRGVAYHGATIGERGAEAVVPLTDTAQMQKLGATIGKFVTVNADITLELESRILARVMKEINQNNQFMRNGG